MTLMSSKGIPDPDGRKFFTGRRKRIRSKSFRERYGVSRFSPGPVKAVVVKPEPPRCPFCYLENSVHLDANACLHALQNENRKEWRAEQKRR